MIETWTCPNDYRPFYAQKKGWSPPPIFLHTSHSLSSQYLSLMILISLFNTSFYHQRRPFKWPTLTDSVGSCFIFTSTYLRSFISSPHELSMFMDASWIDFVFLLYVCSRIYYTLVSWDYKFSHFLFNHVTIWTTNREFNTVTHNFLIFY